ncbi:2-iminoacetate synthase ThiH [Maridesulfovibrio hydrothermalis]|uniref:Thiazole biosynthesis protein ThiH n=1 Tax=Maridesulfovibrio hydrothermalis AM13 = DSM 14728 TaxID=1121451 RepID=L0RF04_9BACT|nr:2-iminoacetate synthase ThiH [Maridesulfovibrio hydrothermalis]CCO24136.1 Thiazole biosynthesis protein ThiH [Maridesulfovibrio hydrothermalis AM13 = DSM 14728]
MSFYPICAEYNDANLAGQFRSVTEQDVKRAINKTTLSPEDFLALLSPAAVPFIEEMAQKASQLTLQHFGRTIQLFTPLYLSNFCTNRCIYCGFNTKNDIPRTQLDPEQIEEEAKAIAATGLKHLLILTGDARTKASPEYLKSCLEILSKYFPSVSIEIYAMTEDEYAMLVNAGVDGLTMFQETYNENLYPKLHPAGPKKDFRNRLDAPERGCKAGMRVVNIGALLGLDVWQHDALITGIHAAYLQNKYPDVDIAVSLPRMRTHAGNFRATSLVSDQDLVQNMLALRIFLPRAGITISTRENAQFRENILPLGVTRMSAGVSTEVGGHSQDGDKVGQFDISDERSVEEMCKVLKNHGYQPVFKDWEPIGA